MGHSSRESMIGTLQDISTAYLQLWPSMKSDQTQSSLSTRFLVAQKKIFYQKREKGGWKWGKGGFSLCKSGLCLVFIYIFLNIYIY